MLALSGQKLKQIKLEGNLPAAPILKMAFLTILYPTFSTPKSPPPPVFECAQAHV